MGKALLPVYILFDNLRQEVFDAETFQYGALSGSGKSALSKDYESELRKYLFDMKILPPTDIDLTYTLMRMQLYGVLNPNDGGLQFTVDMKTVLFRILLDCYFQQSKYSSVHPYVIVLLTKNRMTTLDSWQSEWDKLLNEFHTDVEFYTTPPPKKNNLQINSNAKLPVGQKFWNFTLDNLSGLFGTAGLKYKIENKINKIPKNLPIRVPPPLSPAASQPKQNSSSFSPSGTTGSLLGKPTSAMPHQSVAEKLGRETLATDSSSAIKPTAEKQSTQPPAPEPPAPKPIELKPVQPAEWQIKDPPLELKDRTSPTQNQTLDVGDWYICGASRRGKLHENEATFREDAFAVQYAGEWVLVAVADGAGSHHLSRVGSNLSVYVAIETLAKRVTEKAPHEDAVAGFLENALDESLLALSRESVKRNIDIRDLSTTLLLLMFHQRKNLIGVAQVGDGLLAVQFADTEIAPLGNPESGEYSGQTYFLTNHQKGSFKNNVSVLKPDKDLKYFFVMTDGVADDLYPPTERLPGLIKAIPEVIASDNPDKALLELINYNRPGSFDDRTLVVVCKRKEIVKEASAQMPQQTFEARSPEPQPAQHESAPAAREVKPTVSSVSTATSADKINDKEQGSSEIPNKSVDDSTQATQQVSNKTGPDSAQTISG